MKNSIVSSWKYLHIANLDKNVLKMTMKESRNMNFFFRFENLILLIQYPLNFRRGFVRDNSLYVYVPKFSATQMSHVQLQARNLNI